MSSVAGDRWHRRADGVKESRPGHADTPALEVREPQTAGHSKLLREAATCLSKVVPATTPTPADPRPCLIGGRIAGSTCTACGHNAARRHPRCERCLGNTIATDFGPTGVVWSSATVHLRIGELTPPFVLAYIDVDAGPRVLAQVVGGNEIPAGGLVRFTGEENGNLTVKAVGQ